MDNKSCIKLSEPWYGKEVNEGDGALVFRVIGLNKVSDIDPFLMMDFFKDSKLPGGFPDHPHRGFETVTYLIEGKIFHEDFKGHKGEIEEGDIQWMTAGKGIVHAEMPYSYKKPTSGIQLWINLSKKNKMMDPHYQEITKDKIPKIIDKNGNYKITLVAGKIGEIEGPCKSTTPTSFFDISLISGFEYSIPIYEAGLSGFIFMFEGDTLDVDNKTLKKDQAIRFDSENAGEMKLKAGKKDIRVVMIFGKPLKEPIAKYGPFVMNTQQELQEAFNDYKMAKNGFENRLNWESKIQYMTENTDL